MSEDPRCCGSGTCIIDPAGRCWCGQQWDGQKMSRPPLASAAEGDAPASDASPTPRSDRGQSSERSERSDDSGH